MSAPSPHPRQICIARILGAHGVKGQVKLASFTEEPDDVAAYGPLSDQSGQRQFTVKLGAWNKTHFICTLSGVASREQAEALKGTDLFVPRSCLPKAQAGEYYYADLIGLEARLANGEVFGKVLDMKNYGAGDIIEISRPGGAEMLPYNKQVVSEVNLDGGYLVINPPEMIDGE